MSDGKQQNVSSPLQQRLDDYSGTEVSGIRDVLVMLLKQLDTPLPRPEYDPQFAQAACDEAMRLGFSPIHVNSPEFQRALQPSAAMCMTLYPHLDIPARYYICLYTTCAIYFDDLALKDANVVKEFDTSFLEGKEHLHPVLDGFAILLRTTSQHFNEICASMIIATTLDYMSSLVMEGDQQGMTVHTAAINYPGYLRYLTGIARSYALFFFPPSIPMKIYIQILPDMIHYFEDVNDIFSFYKEELEGETSNHICLISQVRGCSKLEALEHLAQVTIDGVRRIMAVLEPNPEACSLARRYLVEGYIGFHALSRERYRLDELLLDGEEF